MLAIIQQMMRVLIKGCEALALRGERADAGSAEIVEIIKVQVLRAGPGMLGL